MKKTALLFWLCVCSLSLPFNRAFGGTEEVSSRISGVIVYPDAAVITRTAALDLRVGQQQIVFSDIIPEVDDNSLKVSGSGTAEVKILGAQVKRENIADQPAEKVRMLQDEIQELQDNRKALEDGKNVLSDEKAYLDSIRLFANGQVPKDLVTRMPPAQELEDAFKFLDAKLKDNFLQSRDLDIKIREINKRIDVLNRELAQISSGTKKLKRNIAVDLQVERAGTLELKVSYLVRGAYWYPVYDARADFQKSEVELIAYGLARQTTGDEWKEVEMSLSTARPSISGRMPYIQPWFVKPYVVTPASQPVGRVKYDRVAKQSMAFSLEAGNIAAGGIGGPEEALAEKKEKDAELALSQSEERGISVIYKLARPVDVKPDGSEHKLPVSAQVLKADFEYSAYPRLSPFAYLGSRVTNAKDLQLLGGRVNVFLDGDFVGTSSIDSIGPQEEFDLYLGVDEGVKIKRQEVERKVDDVLIAGIPSPNRKVTSKNKLTVENYKGRKIRVNLFEAIPVSQDERIKVKIIDVSLEPKEKDWKDRKGIWRWELNLEPKAKQEIFYTYIVECPRDMQVEGL